MKAYRFILALSVLAVSACSVKEINETAKTSERELTIEAYRADDDAQTKTYLKESDGSVWWVPGDAISLFYGSGSEGGSLFSSQATDTAKVTNFTGTINVITGGAEVSLEDTFFWGLYPYSESASCDGIGVTMTLPAVQTAQAGTFATGAAPSIGRSQGLHMGFYNICGGLKFSVTKAGVNKVTLKSRNGEAIAGTAKVSFDSEGLPVSEILDGSDVVVLSAPAGETFEPGKFYYILMFPATMAGGFMVTLETASETATYEKTTAITAKRAIFGRIPDIDAGLTYTPKNGNIPIEDANFKAYLVEAFDNDEDGEISYAEAASIRRIEVCTDNITSLHGIEFMPNLYFLKAEGSAASSGKLTMLDVSENAELQSLHCSYNQLTDLDISWNPALLDLRCRGNQLMDLDVSGNAALKILLCNSNDLTTLDVSSNTALKDLRCGNNLLTVLDVSGNAALETLVCSPMTDAQGNNLLATLYVSLGQEVPNVTVDRSTVYIPAETRIVVKPEAVDLGLSVKWAPFNLGASAPEGYGDYFAWGETAPREEYDFGTYSLCDESYNSLQKYNNNSDYGIVDDKTVLEPEDDAAHVNWGGSWRMPTDAEFTELIQNCTCTLTTLNGIHGIRMTSNVEGYTDKSIFLPASGSRVGTRLLMIDARGTYWSSSLYTERSYKANTFDFYSSPQPGSNPLDRYTGLPVRPVCE